MIRKPLVINNGRKATLPAGDSLSSADVDITGTTEVGAALADSDELPVYDASETANRKSLLSRIWTYIQTKFGAAIASGQIPFSDGTGLTSNAELLWDGVNREVIARGFSAKHSSLPIMRIVNTGYALTENQLNALFTVRDKNNAEVGWWGYGSSFNNNFYFHNNAGGFFVNVKSGESFVSALSIIEGGAVGIGATSPSAQLHVQKTTEQLRLGYDATKFLSATVDSSGNTLLDGTGAIRLGDSSNHTQIATDGTLTLVGTATAWDDLLVEMKESLKGNATKPDWDATNLAFAFPRNDATEILYFNIQMPHRWKEGSTIYPHVHFYQDQNAAPTFKIDYRWTNIGDAVSGSWTTYTMSTLVGTQTWTTGLLHRIMSSATGISGSGKTFSSILQIKLYRDDNTYVGDALAVSFDIHFEIDSFGTSSEYAK